MSSKVSSKRQSNYPRHNKDTGAPRTSPLTEGPGAEPTGKIRTLDAGNETGSYENMFILRSWRGQALNLFESSRISAADVTWPGFPRETSSARGRLLVDAALSAEISSMVDLKRTEGCWVFWGSGFVGSVLESGFARPTLATMFAIASS